MSREMDLAISAQLRKILLRTRNHAKSQNVNKIKFLVTKAFAKIAQKDKYINLTQLPNLVNVQRKNAKDDNSKTIMEGV